jgi:hypothetical protein
MNENIVEKPSKFLVDEIKQIYNVTDWSHFKAKKQCILNPTLGSSKKKVSGDADLIIDDTLFELKTSKHFILKRNDFNQLLAYYFLSTINVKLKSGGVAIKKIGIYLPRFNYLKVVPISDFHDKGKEVKQKRDFFRLLANPTMKLV